MHHLSHYNDLQRLFDPKTDYGSILCIAGPPDFPVRIYLSVVAGLIAFSVWLLAKVVAIKFNAVTTAL
jgi:hypothetical protein